MDVKQSNKSSQSHRIQAGQDREVVSEERRKEGRKEESRAGRISPRPVCVGVCLCVCVCLRSAVREGTDVLSGPEG